MTSTDDDGSQRAELLLGPLLRHVDETSATVWVETSHPTSVSVLHATTDTFTVHGRHFALMVIEGLEPGTTTPYEVHLGGPTGRRVWPRPDSDLPPSVIRTPVAGRPVSILLGSCRAAAPHEPPYTLELTFDAEGRGVDALWAHGRRMLSQSPDAWPDLVLFLGDQIYADDSSPRARQRIARRRDDDATLPPEVVAGFEEYCWLYHEAWSAEVERWLLATVPSAMIMDDHDMIDDWNISSSWVDDIRREPWWFEHLLGGLMSYWVYQHLGNLSPDRIRAEGLLEQLIEAGDGTAILRAHLAPPSGDEPSVHPYRFSHCRRVGDVTAMVIDCRTARLLTENHRQMLHDGEWAWVRAELEAVEGHLLIGTSLPVFIADGLHDLQVWNERICAGAWGRPTARVGEWLRRSLDLEDWSAFGRSYHRFVDLIEELRHRPSGPQSIVVASGDIHFSYAAEVPPRSPVGI
ncbi:MAG: alkaline phosphatase D family protein, partial [Actinomycetota bacterium]